jgi:hypothetical protein
MLGLIGLGISLILGLTQFMAISQAAILATGIVFLAFLIMAWGSLYNPIDYPASTCPLLK